MMNKQDGYTLIEIMIAMTLGLIVVGGAMALYISTIRGGSDTVKAVRLNHDLEATMALMINDIRRAGYWGGASVGANSDNNPFTSETTDMTNITVRNLAAPTADTTSGDCILYSYDDTVDGIVGSVDAGEHYGFRLNGGTINMRLSGTAAAPVSCDNTGNTWEENIAGDQITITTLNFDLGSSKCLNVTTGISFDSPCSAAAATAGNLNSGDQIVETREIAITLSGRLTSDATVTKTLTDIAKVRNDRVFIQP